MTRAQNNDDAAVKGSKGIRRSHQKSRGGCSFCKRRRIKCDERQPSCTNCVKRSLWCSLNTSPSPASTPENTAQAIPTEPLPGSQAMERHDDSAFTLDVQDLQLFHHFCSVTSTTFGPSLFVQQFWNLTVAQMSFSHPFLLRAILAIGGLHMNYLAPTGGEATGWYKTKARVHWQAAVRLATPRLGAIDADSCDPLFTFAMLSCLHTFASGPQLGNFLLFTDDAETEWPIFFRGLRTVAEASVLFGMTEPARPLAFIYGIAKLDFDTLPPREEPVTAWWAALRSLRQLMTDEVSGDEERSVYQDALHRLSAGFAAVFGDGETAGRANSLGRANSQVVFAWLYHVSEKFVGRLQARENLALVFYAYFVVLIKQIDGVWMIKGWPEHLIAGIYYALVPASRLWIRWPMERIGWFPPPETRDTARHTTGSSGKSLRNGKLIWSTPKVS